MIILNQKRLCNLCFIILIFLILFFYIVPFSNAVSSKVEVISLDYSGAIIKVSADSNISSLRLYIKNDSGKFIQFFSSFEKGYREKTLSISSFRLSKNRKTEFKVIIEDISGNYSETIFSIDDLPDKLELVPSTSPSSSPTSVPTTPVGDVASISLNKYNLSLDLNGTKVSNLTATIIPNNAKTSLTWSSSNSNVATVSNGKVTAVAVGTTTISVKSSNNKSASCKVTVKDSSSNIRQTQSNFLASLKNISNQVAKDKNWSYYNSMSVNGWSFSKARAKKRRTAQCAALPYWGLVEIGVLKEGQSFYSNGSKIVWRNSEAKKNMLKYAKIIKVNKTPNQLLKEGNLKAGDICLWTFQHTNVYAGNKKWYDAGHASCVTNNGPYAYDKYKSSGFGPITCNSYMSKKILYIIRLNK